MVARGEVWWVDFGDPIGSEPGYRRPALVVSSDRFNRSRLATVVVVAITTDLRLAEAPGNVALDTGSGGLDRPSVVNVSQVMTLDRSQLDKRSGTLPRSPARAVDDGLRLALALP